MKTMTDALKEWQVAVNALEQGDTIMLLRKGGIREAGGRFRVERDRVLLYPTFEHQKPELLKPNYAAQVQPVGSGWHPAQVQIGAWARVTDVFQVTEADIMSALLPFHIWNQEFVTERLQWKPSQPLYVLLLRVHRLGQPQQILYSDTYGGCKSWINLALPVPLDESYPVLDDTTYASRVEAIRSAIVH
ncbi:MAG: DUF1802 family protein [Leptolyngbyaceae cyanobacterium RU_5_1]|nr:DUF1802 family protein [Leptolyngbyaceae cyanobacterium RU_5_1]